MWRHCGDDIYMLSRDGHKATVVANHFREFSWFLHHPLSARGAAPTLAEAQATAEGALTTEIAHFKKVVSNE